MNASVLAPEEGMIKSMMKSCISDDANASNAGSCFISAIASSTDLKAVLHAKYLS